MHFNKLIVESDNKVKTVWKIVKKETGKQSTDIEIPPIKINDNIVDDPKHIANSFNTYYTGIKLFSNLPPTIKSLNHDIKIFKPALKDHLLTHSFYSVDDFTSVENS
jgi:hypothetical protein